MNLQRQLAALKPIGYLGTSCAERLKYRLGVSRPLAPVGIVIEKADWAIRWWGTYTSEEANKVAPGISHVTTNPATQTAGIVEFGSQYQCVEWSRYLSQRCRIVTTFFHGKPEDGPDVARHIERFLELEPRIDRIVASASVVRDRLLSWGIAREKIAHIPIGCETWRFRPPTPQGRREARARFGIPEGAVCIASFQKDGEGWGAGDSPKLIKGPDLFVAAIEKLKAHVPVFVLLTGPARGYVKNGLERIGVPYAHHYADDRDDLARCYHAVDLYLVTSREEGGPMALMESMASGVPVVSTAVGMAPDLIVNGETGGLVREPDAELIAERALDLLAAEEKLQSMRLKAREAVKVADWSVVGRRHVDEVWSPLLKELKS